MRFMLAALCAVGFVSSCPAPERSPTSMREVPPEVTFRLNKGWLDIQVADRGKPMADVKVKCLVGTHVWASGETDDDGRGSFPRPTNDWCQFVFDLGAGPSAPIAVGFPSDGSVTPKSATIKDGTAICCVTPPIRRSEPPRSRTFAIVSFGLLLGLFGIALLAGQYLSNRSSASKSSPHRRIQP